MFLCLIIFFCPLLLYRHWGTYIQFRIFNEKWENRFASNQFEIFFKIFGLFWSVILHVEHVKHIFLHINVKSKEQQFYAIKNKMTM
jgi:hypothetical protein